MLRRLHVVLAMAATIMAGDAACYIEPGVEYLKPAHYKEFKAAENNATVCCARCAADGAKCGSWKLCHYSDGLSCRLLPTAPTHKIGATGRCQASGLPPGSPAPPPLPPPAPAPPPPPAPPPTTGFCDPRDFGATGDGVTVDTAAINAAIMHCGGLVFKSGLVFLTGTLVLKSDLVIVVENNATILGAKGHIMVPPPNPQPASHWYPEGGYQDYGHTHWADSLFFGHAVSNVTVMGGGTVDGNGALQSGTPQAGDGCKMFGLVDSSGVTLSGVTTHRGGWFTVLATNTEHLTLKGMTIHAARDALDIMGCRHVLITEMNISGGGDDAVKFGSDYSRSKVVDSFNINVTNSVVGSNGCNALQFGSETLGNFHDFLFENISVTAAGKAGIGIVSMDGARIFNIIYNNITMLNTTSAIYMYIGGRLRRPPAGLPSNDSLVGAIHDITISNVHATHVSHGSRNWTATIEGQPPDDLVGIHEFHYAGPNIVFLNFTVRSAGGGLPSDAAIIPPHPSMNYPPRYLGHRPAFGMFIRRAREVSLSGVDVSYATTDGRPAFILSDVQGVRVDGTVTAKRSEPWIGYDIGLREKCEGLKVGAGSSLIFKNISASPRDSLAPHARHRGYHLPPSMR